MKPKPLMILPNCPYCGSASKTGGGGEFSHLRSIQNYGCGSCEARFTRITQAGCEILVATHTENEMEALEKWFNTAVNSAFACYQEKLDDLREKRFERWLRCHFLRTCPQDEAYLTERSFYKLSEAGKKHVRAYCNRERAPRLGDPIFPCPPQVPDALPFVYVRVGNQFKTINRNVSARTPLCEHPCVRKDREYWSAVCATVKQQFPEMPAFAAWRAIQNRYENSDYAPPWYQFTFNGAEFTVGYRKRVASLQIAPGRNLQELKDLAYADTVTFWTDSESTGIHAWTQDKAVEYLCVMLRAVI